jgi:ABC-type uncharacterized transport system substrate-binding protein
LAGLALAVPRILRAQPAARVLRIATLEDGSEKTRRHYWNLFRTRLRELGRVEGKDFVFERRYSGEASERLPALAAELAALKPDILVAVSTPATQAVMKATSSVPVVFIAVTDPVGARIVASLSHPGGNLTGVSNMSPEIVGKWLELLREMAPAAKQLAFLGQASNRGAQLTFSQLQEHARSLKVEVRFLDARERDELERSFKTIKRDGVQGMLVGSSQVLLDNRDRIVQFAAAEKLPAVYGRREYVDAGGLLSYDVDFDALYRRAAEYVHRILQGAKPADLPVDRASRLRLAVNLKAARALGIQIPDSIRTRADEVIE